jgi:hypothetical protein
LFALLTRSEVSICRRIRELRKEKGLPPKTEGCFGKEEDALIYARATAWKLKLGQEACRSLKCWESAVRKAIHRLDERFSVNTIRRLLTSCFIVDIVFIFPLDYS